VNIPTVILGHDPGIQMSPIPCVPFPLGKGERELIKEGLRPS